MFSNRVTDILGIRYPILEGGMAIAGNGELAAAVSNGGGLGVVAANPGWSPMTERIENVRQHIRRAKALTDKPVGANVPLFFLDNFANHQIAMLIEEKVDVVITSGGSPKILTGKLKAAGIKMIHVVSNVRQAIAAQAAGVDIVVCEGYEAGGIEGADEITTMVLTPLVAQAVDIPVVAAGGIADGRGFMAAMALGAEGVQMGTAFLAASECHVHPRFKEAIVNSPDAATVMTQRILGRLSRVLKTDFTVKMVDMDRRNAIDELKDLIASVPPSIIGSNPSPTINGQYRVQMLGDLENGDGAAGQSAALVKEVKGAADIIAEVIAGAEAIACRWGGIAAAAGKESATPAVRSARSASGARNAA